MSQREQEILTELKLSGGSSRIQFLAERLDVSEETIRRHLRVMEDQGLVTKVHGGVHLKNSGDEQPLNVRMTENAEAKRVIAAEVARLVRNGDRLFLDVGSTTAFIAMALQRHHDLFVVTNSLVVAGHLATRNGNRVFLAGGELRPHDGGSFGAEARDFIRRFAFDHAILSIAAINDIHGFMLQDLQEAELSRAAIGQAANRIIVADGAKFGRSAPIIVDVPSRFDMVVTDRPPPAAIAAMLDDNKVATRLAGGRPQS